MSEASERQLQEQPGFLTGQPELLSRHRTAEHTLGASDTKGPLSCLTVGESLRTQALRKPTLGEERNAHPQVCKGLRRASAWFFLVLQSSTDTITFLFPSLNSAVSSPSQQR